MGFYLIVDREIARVSEDGNQESYFDITDGWYTKNYGGKYNNNSTVDSEKNRKPWIDYNAKKIDMVRHRIDELYPEDCAEKSVLLTSLLIGVVKITNAKKEESRKE